MNCIKCGYENSQGAVECLYCGVIFSRIAVHDHSADVEAREHGSRGAWEHGGARGRLTEKTTGVGEGASGRVGFCKEPMGAGEGARGRVGEIAQVLLFGESDSVNAFVFWGRVSAFVLILLYSWTFITYPLEPNLGQSFLHNVDLAFHEAGHIIFMPFGRFMSILGGSLMQVLVPLIFAGAFLLYYRNPFAASVTFWWVGQNLIDVAPYIFDARNRQLVLLGGITGRENSTVHDWYNILSQLDLLRFDHAIAKGIKAMGVFVILMALVWSGGLLVKQNAERSTQNKFKNLSTAGYAVRPLKGRIAG